ncbi:MAG: hypothetical protein J7500_16745 [Sphingomonas sp.]|uniref:DUF6438 domain-containing protein n=1 Tax=Sphingomonas sp. TaxID=28214 RepID=UPI001B1F02FB|nr:DUF6438 domain-containing protein [Sphingomonas sp.]MBO9624358.1 hypothetical protein [Sphingomonas sp.]
MITGRWLVLGLAATALAGCVPPARPGADTGTPVPIEGDSIAYETGPCFGACPVYSVTVHPDGTGIFEGKRFTAVSGTREFRLTRAQYDAFAATLAPYRPASGELRFAPGEPNCTRHATDMPSVDVRWTRAIGDSQHLYFYFGCDREKNRAMADALGNAPDVLPIEALVGEHP